MLATILSEDAPLTELIIYQLTGFGVVLLALTLLWLLCAAMGLAFLKKRPEAVLSPAQKAATTPANEKSPDGIPPHHPAIIAAVVAALLDEPHRITATRILETPANWTNFMLGTWSLEGRHTHFSSHKVR